MPWHEIPLVESIWRQMEAVAQPTNPSSFTLAFVGVGTFLCYQILARPGHGRRRPVEWGQPVAKPQVTSAAVEAPAAADAPAASEDRRVA